MRAAPKPNFAAALAGLPGASSGFRDGGRPNAGILTQYSASIKFENVAMRFMSGFCVVSQFTTDILFSNLTIEAATGSGRGCA